MDYSKSGGAKPHSGSPRHGDRTGRPARPVEAQKGRPDKAALLARMKAAAARKDG